MRNTNVLYPNVSKLSTTNVALTNMSKESTMATNSKLNYLRRSKLLQKSPNPRNNNQKESILSIQKSLRTKWKTFDKKETNPTSLRKISFHLLAALMTTLIIYARENQAISLMTTSLDLNQPSLSKKQTKKTKSIS